LVGDAAATGGHGSRISTVAMHSATLAPEEPATGQLTHYRTFAMAIALPLRGLLFCFGLSMTSDVLGMVPTGGELTLFEAVGRARPDFRPVLLLVAGRGCLA
jgi:hypothetical protein